MLREKAKALGIGLPFTEKLIIYPEVLNMKKQLAFTGR
jgi:hypothetical protein